MWIVGVGPMRLQVYRAQVSSQIKVAPSEICEYALPETVHVDFFSSWECLRADQFSRKSVPEINFICEATTSGVTSKTCER